MFPSSTSMECKTANMANIAIFVQAPVCLTVRYYVVLSMNPWREVSGVDINLNRCVAQRPSNARFLRFISPTLVYRLCPRKPALNRHGVLDGSCRATTKWLPLAVCYNNVGFDSAWAHHRRQTRPTREQDSLAFVCMHHRKTQRGQF